MLSLLFFMVWFSVLAITPITSFAAHNSAASQIIHYSHLWQHSTQQHPQVGDVFQDVINGPEMGPKMMVVPAGTFIMGSAENEHGRYSDESPRHQVTFAKPFALGVTEITVAEFSQFIQATGYETEAEQYGGSWIKSTNLEYNDWAFAMVDWHDDHLGNKARHDNPVIHVSWHDAKAYVNWLAEVTGKPYRLPSEAEFEYANRAGTQTAFWWGNSTPPYSVANVRGLLEQKITPPQIWNFTDEERQHAAKEGPTWYAFPEHNDGYGGVAPVASFRANGFNLHDTTGNVWEWLEDCYVNNYVGAPVDGKARRDGDCSMRVLRGGSFYCFPRHIRSANRWAKPASAMGMYIGFRVARDL